MVYRLRRRTFLATAGLGLSSLLLPLGRLRAEALLGLTGFTHGVASGEPGSDSVLLWTRHVPASGGAAKVRVEVAESREFAKLVGGGEMQTGPWRDHTVKLVIDGLSPNRWYFYRFVATDGSMSPVGRTRTLPVGGTDRFNLAIFSCSNLGFGEFNAYGHAAARDDVDLAIHLGDYFYEYGRGGYDDSNKFSQRIWPPNEVITLADYRLRYASYRADPQLQALHAAYPMVLSADDHETANDSWEGGAQNHQPDEGEWANRKNAAAQAAREWLPVSDQPWQTFTIGDLATYYRTDTRSAGRSKPWSLDEFASSPDPAKAFAEFHDGPWRDPAMTILGSEQESWLYHAFATDKARWSVLGSGTHLGYYSMPAAFADWLPATAPESARNRVRRMILAAEAGLPVNLDNWGGYPAARSRLLAAAQRAKLNLIVVTGDSHNAFAYDLQEGGRPTGVEFAGQSVTSPGIESAIGDTDPAVVERGTVEGRPSELRWMDATNRGYMHLSLTPKAAVNEWVFMQTTKEVSLATKSGHRMQVRHGKRVLESV